MKFVDELVNQTPEGVGEAKKRSASLALKASVGQEAFSLTPEQLALVEPGLEAYYAYLDEFCQILAKKSPTVNVDYDILAMTRLKNLAQSDYKLVAENTLVPRFRFSLLCMSKAGCSLSVGTDHELQEVREFLNANSLRYRVENQSEMRFVVRVEGFVPDAFLFEPHPAKPELRIVARNLDRLGVSGYSVKPERISRELMDEFGKRVLRMDNQFDRMTGFEVSDDIRARLQERVAARNATREAIVEGRARPSVVEPRPTTGASPVSRSSKLGSLFRRKTAKAPRLPAAADDGETATARAVEAPMQVVPADAPGYGWVVTRHALDMDTDVTVGKLGPDGAAKSYRVNQVILKGRPFRMRDEDGDLIYSGFLVGEATGFEPLEDYGKSHGCASIEYEQDGFWVRLKRPAS